MPFKDIYNKSSLDRAFTVAYNNTRCSLSGLLPACMHVQGNLGGHHGRSRRLQRMDVFWKKMLQCAACNDLCFRALNNAEHKVQTMWYVLQGLRHECL